MAGSHHYSAVAVQGPDGVGKQRRRECLRHQEGVDTRGREDRSGLLGENVGVVAGVVADDGAWPGARRSRRDGTGQERREPGRRAPDNHTVHPVRPGTQRGAEACRAELQRAAEAVLEFLAGGRNTVPGALDEFCQSGGSGWIRVLGGPVPGVAQQLRKVGIGRRHRNKAIA
ncbi:hypothetical protein D9M72_424950 [compost metagenome]